MAQSLSHTFGQIIGDLLETGLETHLRQFAKKHKLYLDKKGKRIARSGQKVSWKDDKENKHDLDFVMERGGTDEKLGVPVAFIESAWRRYTKHSRNKAQEIQGAILPLAFKYKNVSPFIGVVLAGEFTKGAISQLESIGFTVLYFPYQTVVKAFKKYGIDAAFGESTPEEEFQKKLAAWAVLPNKPDIAKELMRLNKAEVANFFDTFSKRISRFVEQIIILPLHGEESATSSVLDALAFLKLYEEGSVPKPFIRYEITIKYNTGDKIEASFKEKVDAIQFLESYK